MRRLESNPQIGYLFDPPAQVVKLVDALASGASVRKDVKVRVLSWAPIAGSTPFVGALILLAFAALQSFHIRQVLSSPGRNFVRQEVFFRQKENIRAT